MTFPSDPARWTSSPDEAPDELRAAFSAAAKEGPSDLQMKMLALKLAAVSAGGAAAATAGTAKAAATTAGGATVAKGAGTLTVAKLVAALAVAGAGVAGVAVYRGREAEPPARVQAPAPVQVAVPAPIEAPAPVAPVEPAPSSRGTDTPIAAPTVREVAPLEADEQVTREPVRKKKRLTRAEVRRQKVLARRERAAHEKAKHTLGVEVVRPESSATVAPAVPTEMELLRRARSALAARPREAYALTEQHREHYPHGTFVQERDALAIEALMRAGDMAMAKDLARRFVREYPSSPHAHRFRETMGLD